MSSLISFNSSETMPFLALSVVFLFVGPAIFVGIVTMWANLKQKISYELTKIAYESIDSAVSVEVGKIKHEISANLTAEINTAEINTEELYSRVSEINDKSTAEINKIKNEISNFTAEIKARDNAFLQRRIEISASLNTIANKFSEIEKILEQHHNNFCEISSKFAPINSSIEILQNDMAQRYAVIPRPDFDQQSVSNESETNSGGSSTNSSSSSSGSSGSSQKFANIISVIREQFSAIFDRVRGANNYSLDQMCGIVSVDILSRLGMGVIGKDTIKGFYRGKI